MQKFILALTVFLFFGHSIYSQRYAGQIGAGEVAFNPNIHLVENDTMSIQFAELDADQDGVADFRFRYDKGNIPLDGPASGGVTILNPQYSLCDSTISFGTNIYKVHFYNLFDTLKCEGNWSWNNTDSVLLGATQTFVVLPVPPGIDQKYVFFKKDNQDPMWMSVSFSFQSSPTFLRVNLISRALNPNVILEGGTNFKIYPNPTFNNRVKIESEIPFHITEVKNLLGKQIPFEQKGNELYFSGNERGLFLVKVKSESNNETVFKVILGE